MSENDFSQCLPHGKPSSLSSSTGPRGFPDPDSQFKSCCPTSSLWMICLTSFLGVSIMTKKCLCGNELELLIHLVLGCRSMLEYSKVFGVYLFFFPTSVRNDWQEYFEGWCWYLLLSWDASCFWNTSLYIKSEQLQVGSYVDVPHGRNFGTYKHSFKYIYFAKCQCKISVTLNS